MPSNRNLADLGASIDSGIAGEFLTVGDSGGLFRNPAWTEIASKPTTLDSAVAIALIDSAYIQARQTDVGLDSALTTSLVDSAYIQARSSVTGLDSAGAINLIDSAYLAARVSGGLDSAGVTGIVDSAYVSARASVNSGFGTYTYFATAGQTDFSGSDVDGNVLAYTADGIIVWYNGVQMLDTDDYTASNGTSVSLTRGADSGSSLVIGKWAVTAPPAFSWGGDRGLAAGGYTGSATLNVIDYWDITTAGNATDFGDLTATLQSGSEGTGNGTRGVFSGGYVSGAPTYSNVIQYVTTASTGNASDFGDLTQVSGFGASGGDGTYAVVAIGLGSSTTVNNIDYFTISTTGNASDFGDTTLARRNTTAAENETYTLFLGGGTTATNTIDYVTVASPGNATDFGDLSAARQYAAACSDATRAVVAGGTEGSTVNTMEYVTVATPGNAIDFGDLVNAVQQTKACSNGTYGNWSGGNLSTTRYSVIHAATIQTPANATDHGDLTSARNVLVGALSGSAS